MPFMSKMPIAAWDQGLGTFPAITRRNPVAARASSMSTNRIRLRLPAGCRPFTVAGARYRARFRVPGTTSSVSAGTNPATVPCAGTRSGQRRIISVGSQ